MKTLAWLAQSLLILMGGCAALTAEAPVSGRQLTATSQPMAVASSVPGIANFARVSPVLYRGEQPTAEGFDHLRELGIKTIVSLRAFHDDRSLLVGRGFIYVRIPSHAWHPEDEDMIEILRVVRDPAKQPVFVHCQQGSDRTGCAVAVYRMVEQGWSAEDAAAEMTHFHTHRIWWQIPPYLKQLDVAKIGRSAS